VESKLNKAELTKYLYKGNDIKTNIDAEKGAPKKKGFGKRIHSAGAKLMSKVLCIGNGTHG
jgi:hypothetical protein